MNKHIDVDKQKKPYQAPVMHSEQLHETSALACGKSTPVQQDCFQQPAAS